MKALALPVALFWLVALAWALRDAPTGDVTR